MFYAILDVPDEVLSSDVAAGSNELRFVELSQKQAPNKYVFSFGEFCELVGVEKFEAARKRLEAKRAADRQRREEEFLGRGPLLHCARATA